MTGALTLSGNAVNPLHAVPKQQLDVLSSRFQRISLAGGKQFDVQVPADAKLCRFVLTIYPTTTAFYPVIRVSVAPGVFLSTVGNYLFSGFAHYTLSSPTAVAGTNQQANINGFFMGGHASILPLIIEGTITLTRPSTGDYFTCFSKSTLVGATGYVTAFYNGNVVLAAAGSALNILALRVATSGDLGDNWRGESYLNVEWL